VSSKVGLVVDRSVWLLTMISTSNARMPPLRPYQTGRRVGLPCANFSCRFLTVFATANFKEAYFSKGFLRDSNFDGADFSNAIVDRASFSGSSLKGAIFTNAVSSNVLVQYITQLFCSLHVSYLHAGPDGDFLRRSERGRRRL
jgi:hypothetical protein